MQPGTQAVQPRLFTVEVANSARNAPVHCEDRENMQKWLKQNKNKQMKALFLDAQICAGPFQNLAIPLCLSTKEKPPIVGRQSPKVLAGQVYPFLASLIN